MANALFNPLLNVIQFFIRECLSVRKMGRKKIFDFEKYVTFNEDNNSSSCNICQKMFKGKVTGNIKRHYDVIHKIKICENSDYQHVSTSECIARKKRDYTSINLSKNEFLLCCVGLVTVKNIPFRIFDDEEYFKKILQPFEDCYKTSLNSKNIVCKINYAANEIKQQIAKSVSKKMICLKIDIASRMEKKHIGRKYTVY